MISKILLSGRPHLEYSDKRLADLAAKFPVAYDGDKRLAASAVVFPLTLENLAAKIDGLYLHLSKLIDINEKLVVYLGKIVDFADSKEAELPKDIAKDAGEGQRRVGEYVS